MEQYLTEASSDAALEQLYRATTYRIDSDAAVVDVRIGACQAGVDALLTAFGVTDWAFITAWNPGSQPTDAATNADAQGRLLACVRAAQERREVRFGRANSLAPGRVFEINAAPLP